MCVRYPYQAIQRDHCMSMGSDVHVCMKAVHVCSAPLYLRYVRVHLAIVPIQSTTSAVRFYSAPATTAQVMYIINTAVQDGLFPYMCTVHGFRYEQTT